MSRNIATKSSSSLGIRELLSNVSDSWGTASILYTASKLPFPLWHFRLRTSPKLPTVALFAGIHGDEIAGCHALLEFMQHDLAPFTKRLNFEIFPCVNPFGISMKSRTGYNGLDINRYWISDTICPEARAIIHRLAELGLCYRAVIDLHEDLPSQISDFGCPNTSPDGYYLYETARYSELRIGFKITTALLSRDVRVATAPIVYGDRNLLGVIPYGPDSSNSATDGIADLDTFIVRHYTDHVLTLESDGAAALKDRINAHKNALSAALTSLAQ